MAHRPTLCLAVLAVLTVSGCGEGDTDDERASADGAGAELTLELTAPREVASGGSVTWSLAVVNHTDGPIELVCPTGQQADVELRRGGDAVAYRWSDERFFTQAVRHMQVEPGETTIELQEPSLDVPPGEYAVQATIACDPAPAPARAELVVTD